MIAYAIVALVAAQRLAELFYARRNTRRLLANGAAEMGRKHYPLFMLLHAAWLLAILFALRPNDPLHWIPLLGYVVCECLRGWTMLSLGPYWTTRIITLPGAPLVRRGPYRFLRHPNYLVVIGEIALLPLVLGEVWIAIVFSLLNGALLSWRMHVENQALAPRRQLNWTFQ